jgi:hypothetical protein
MKQEERRKYGDILVINEPERYFGLDSVLTYKTASFFWIASVSKAKWAMKLDDDTFVNVPNLLKVTASMDPTYNFYGGFLTKYQPPERDPKSKWFVPERLWMHHVYPPYCSGAGYLMSISTVTNIVRYIRNAAFNPNEDVYMGILAYWGGVSPETLSYKVIAEEFYLADEKFARLFLMSKVDYAKLPKWKQDDIKKKMNMFW